MSSILPSLVGFAISIVRCLISGSFLRMDKVFYFLTFLSVDREWLARDRVSLLGAPSSFNFLFLSRVPSSHESMLITLEEFPREFMLNIFLLDGMIIFSFKEKVFFGVCEMSFEESWPFSTSKVFFVSLSNSADSFSLLLPSPRSTTYIWGLLGRRSAVLIDGTRLL